LVPAGRTDPAFGVVEITSPLAILLDALFVVFPIRQLTAFSTLFAARTGVRVSNGT
jgi:hypothetical protein